MSCPSSALGPTADAIQPPPSPSRVSLSQSSPPVPLSHSSPPVPFYPASLSIIQEKMDQENASWPIRAPLVAATDDQRPRISLSFRAAKPHLSRKRPQESPSLCHAPKCTGTNVSSPLLHASPIPRVSLADIQTRVPIEDGYSTPAKPPEICNGFQDVAVSPHSDAGFLDDELDEAFLQEVDALCEQRTTAMKQRPGPRSMARDSSAVEDRKQLREECTNLFQDTNDGSAPQKYYEYMKSLNDAQRGAACSNISVPLMIVAGPGSGKTSTMVGRVLTLLKEGIGPSNILAMTFTTAAASEMRDRIGAVVGKVVAKELAISTFHSFCLQLCRTHAENLAKT